jgi:hypothetical protein
MIGSENGQLHSIVFTFKKLEEFSGYEHIKFCFGGNLFAWEHVQVRDLHKKRHALSLFL